MSPDAATIRPKLVRLAVAMLHAELHGKMAPGADDAERREDILTSTIFGTLFAADAWGVLIDWLRRARTVTDELTCDVAPSELRQYWFWPRLDNAEPDLVVRIGNRLLIVEVKYHSGKSGSGRHAAGADERSGGNTKDQLVRQWRACSPAAVTSSYPSDLIEALDHCTPALVYLVQRARVPRERDAIEVSMTYVPDAQMHLLTWEDLDEVLATMTGHRWISEVRAYLHKKKLSPFRGFHTAMGAARPDYRLQEPRYLRAANLCSAFASSTMPMLQRLATWQRRSKDDRG